MKTIVISTGLMLLALAGFSQSPDEAAILKLSGKVFSWEVENKIDSLDQTLAKGFTAFTSAGDRQDRSAYMATLTGGKVVHNNIVIEENFASVVNNTATVGGKGKFTITINGSQKTIHLSYLEVFIRANPHDPWKMLALHAGLLPN
ncbi:uncharacterized protein DUF4440 [Mucilaginibacter gracilis]|uniref:Uncharacterized protein DUF4440 n=1 Tax=Mucilaginibacter gracilis TaxID=423350 RepID=A0A495J3D7_9SPHI|nr:nuclear transport factor 2 family protein [Mucilaginibacter gracilis]RKR82888.1 uncharacterized protein DUF4440 [Mucilaginibacter gracilis]